MKVLVCGSRDVDPFDAWEIFKLRLSKLPNTTSPREHLIISGGARGADAIGHRVAKTLGYSTVTFKADWKTHGRRAGILRNMAMLDQEPDLVVALWDGTSRGTKHTIDEAERRGIPVEILQ